MAGSFQSESGYVFLIFNGLLARVLKVTYIELTELDIMETPFLKIDAPEVLAIPIEDNGEPLIDLSEKYPSIFVDKTRAYAQEYSESISLLRRGVAERLMIASESLPKNIKFKIIEGHRPVSAQRKIFTEQVEKFRKQYPEWDEEKLNLETATYVAPPDDTPPHSTGGAIDLTLMTVDGKELDMGTDLNGGYSGTCNTNAISISVVARNNRNLLIRAMEKAGFVNYPAEWWHWSYGDRYWAHASGLPLAIYGTK